LDAVLTFPIILPSDELFTTVQLYFMERVDEALAQ
jgi:hypothetical protein